MEIKELIQNVIDTMPIAGDQLQTPKSYKITWENKIFLYVSVPNGYVDEFTLVCKDKLATRICLNEIPFNLNEKGYFKIPKTLLYYHLKYGDGSLRIFGERCYFTNNLYPTIC